MNHSESNWNKFKAKTNSEQYYNTTMSSLFWLLLNSLHLKGIKTFLIRFFSTNYEKVCGLCEVHIEYCCLLLYELKPKMMKNFLHHLHVNYQHNAKTPLTYSKRTCVLKKNGIFVKKSAKKFRFLKRISTGKVFRHVKRFHKI